MTSYTQIGLGALATTNTANTVAVLFPAIVVRASDIGGCCSVSRSSRVLTLLSWSTSRRTASKGMGTPLSR
jgi:hypothetical protein